VTSRRSAGDIELLAGQQPGRQDVRPQLFLNGRRQASWPVAGQIIPKTQPDTAHRAADWRSQLLSSIENRFFEPFHRVSIDRIWRRRYLFKRTRACI